MTNLPKLADFPAHAYDKLRYGDTDRQGHVNNAVFSTFLETGRTTMLEAVDGKFLQPGYSFVIARLCIDYRAEVFWPGTVDIGTGVKAIGNSSITFFQGIFQNERCVATAETVIVHMDDAAHRSARLSDATRRGLSELLMAVPE